MAGRRKRPQIFMDAAVVCERLDCSFGRAVEFGGRREIIWWMATMAMAWWRIVLHG
jgi:hypothetical protein